jgi:hypothetical protein
MALRFQFGFDLSLKDYFDNTNFTGPANRRLKKLLNMQQLMQR